jgi:CheY-like chemotaxis protein
VRHRGRKNAREALDLMEDLQQDGEHLAVVIADQIMPGMKGVELLEEVHRRSPTTGEDPAHRAGRPGRRRLRDQQGGLDQYIPKPWDEPDLRLTIQNFLSRFRLERERAELLRELQTKNAELATLNSSLEEKVVARTKELENLNARPGRAGDHRRPHRSLQPPPLPRAAVAGDGAQQPHRAAAVGADDRRRSLQGLQRPPRPHGGRQCAARRLEDPAARPARERRRRALRRRGVRHHPAGRGQGCRQEVAERICAQVAEFPFEFGSTQPSGKLTISLGVASFPDDGAEPSLVLSAADRALFAAKNAGRNRVRVAGT